MKTLKLEAYNGELVLPGGEMLMAINPAGDVSVPQWPDPDPQTLRNALYDAREMGAIPASLFAVTLPDGSDFEIDGPEYWAAVEREANMGTAGIDY